MIDPATLDFSALPWVPLSATAGFPAQPGIYFAIDSQDQIQYIGRSGDVRGRWKSHHRYKDLEAIGGVKIAYLFVELPELLPEIEMALIEWFDPPLNIVRRNLIGEDVNRSGRMRNRIKEFVDDRGISVYRFQKDTGISPTTAYALYKDPTQYPAKNVMDAICSAYKVQPGDLLMWVPDEQDASAN